jgi:hypothetical protein
MESFFLNYNIDFDDYITNDVYHNYVPIAYSNDRYIDKFNRDNYKRIINEWFNSTVYNNHSILIKDNDINENIPITNRDICYKIYNDVLETVLDSGYNIIDKNQLKEDIIYFIYRLSKLDN